VSFRGVVWLRRLIPGWMKALSFWVVLTGVVVLSLTPVTYLPPLAFDVWDKAQHAFGFALLTLLGLWAYPGRVPQLLAGLLLLGALIELAQGASGWRHADWMDLLADAIGVVFGLLVWVVWRRGVGTG
jgi:VanZ family protein